MRVGLDLDGVGYPFVSTYKAALRDNIAGQPGLLESVAGIDESDLITRLDEQARSFSWFKYQWNISTEQFYEMFRLFIAQGMFMYGRPRDGYRNLCMELLKAGHEVYIITNREVPGAESESVAQTKAWIKLWDIPHTELVISSDKTVVPTDVFVDDFDFNVKEIIDTGRGPSGDRTIGVLYDRAWNQPEQPPGATYHLGGLDFFYAPYRPGVPGHSIGTRRVFSHDQLFRLVQAIGDPKLRI